MKHYSTDHEEAVHADLEGRLSKWLGNGVPDEGEENYDKWVARRRGLNDMASSNDVHYYTEALLPDADEYLER